MSALARAGGLAYREAGDAGASASCCSCTATPSPPTCGTTPSTHWPLPAGARWRPTCPDTATPSRTRPGCGTWERHVEALERFASELDLPPVALVTHDWGVMIGLRWACDHPDAVSALVISDGGFFSDRRWHDLANVMRTPGDGEKLIAAYTREGFCAAMRAVSQRHGRAALEEYWKGVRRRQAACRTPRAVPLGRLREARPLRRPARRVGRAGADPVGRAGPFAGVKMAQRFHERAGRLGAGSCSTTPGTSCGTTEPEQRRVALVDFLARHPA